jgi:hypothetical protein
MLRSEFLPAGEPIALLDGVIRIDRLDVAYIYAVNLPG